MIRTRGLLALLLAGAVAATADPPQITVDAGFDRRVKGGYIPVRVMFQSQDEGFRGELQVPYRTFQGEALLVRRVTVPPRSRSAFTLCIPVDTPSRQGSLLVVGDDGREVLHPLDCRWVYGGRLVVAIGETAGGLDAGGTAEPADPTKPANPPGGEADPTDVCYLEPRVAPERWPSYRSVNLVLLHQPEPARFSPAQVNALVRWVDLGGHVAVSLGARPVTIEGTWLADLLPCTVNGNVELTGLADLDRQQGKPGPATPRFAVARLEPRPDARIRAQEGSHVLACSARRGGGTVTALAFDYQADPFRGRASVRKLLAGFDAAPDSDRWDQVNMEIAQEVPRDLAAGQALDWRIGAWLAALLGLYLLLLRPLQRRLLAPPVTPRRVFLWMPAVPIGAALAVSVFVLAVPKGPLTAHSAAVMLLRTDSAVAEVHAFRSLRSPDAQQVSIRFDDPDVTVEEECGNQLELVFGGGYRFRQEDASSLEQLSLAPCVPRTFLTTSALDLPGPLLVQIDRSGKTWIATVDNRTGYPIEDLRISVVGKTALLGDVAAGAVTPPTPLEFDPLIAPPAPPAWAAVRPTLRDSLLGALLRELDLDRPAPADEEPKDAHVTGWIRRSPDMKVEALGEIAWQDETLIHLAVPRGKDGS